jgi:hypothetical protein
VRAKPQQQPLAATGTEGVAAYRPAPQQPPMSVVQPIQPQAPSVPPVVRPQSAPNFPAQSGYTANQTSYAADFLAPSSRPQAPQPQPPVTDATFRPVEIDMPLSDRQQMAQTQHTQPPMPPQVQQVQPIVPPAQPVQQQPSKPAPKPRDDDDDDMLPKGW